jgi:flap endonuclease-1
MGVNLSGIVEGKEIELESLAGRTIAIDAFNTMYQFLSIIRDRFTGEPLRDSKGRITSHLSGLLYRTIRLIEVGIKPVYVFDGKPPAFKAAVQEERSEARAAAELKWKAALEKGEIEKVRLYAQASARLTDDMIDEAKKLLDVMGIAWVQAPSEGEAQAAWMCKQGQVWAVGSQDWDSLLFGAERLVRNLAITGKRKLPKKEAYIEIKPEIVELKNVLENLTINLDQLICLGILTGTDYNPGGIKGIGPKTALKIVREKKSFKGIFGALEWPFAASPEQIFDFFKNPPVEKVEIKAHKLDSKKLIQLMVDEHDFSEQRIKKAIERLTHFQKKQTGLDKWI